MTRGTDLVGGRTARSPAMAMDQAVEPINTPSPASA